MAARKMEIWLSPGDGEQRFPNETAFANIGAEGEE
jgi:hypothetical protein